MSWNDERVDLLKRLWSDGLSASQVAARLGGVTRNAVIGKVHRLGLSGRATTSRIKPMRTHKRASVSRAHSMHYAVRGNVAYKAEYDEDRQPEFRIAPAAVEELVIPVAERASILSLKEAMCRWPIGDPGDEEFHFCGRKSLTGMPYCEHHARVAYQPTHGRRIAKRAV